MLEPAYLYDTADKVMTCDCCGQEYDRYWIYEHRGFCIRRALASMEMEIRFDPGWWAFCVFCHALFAAGEIALLVARVKTLYRTDCPDVDVVYSVLPEVLIGECVNWEAGKPRYFLIPEMLA